jgi:hypothetical protein
MKKREGFRYNPDRKWPRTAEGCTTQDLDPHKRPTSKLARDPAGLRPRRFHHRLLFPAPHGAKKRSRIQARHAQRMVLHVRPIYRGRAARITRASRWGRSGRQWGRTDRTSGMGKRWRVSRFLMRKSGSVKRFLLGLWLPRTPLHSRSFLFAEYADYIGCSGYADPARRLRTDTPSAQTR